MVDFWLWSVEQTNKNTNTDIYMSVRPCVHDIIGQKSVAETYWP